MIKKIALTAGSAAIVGLLLVSPALAAKNGNEGRRPHVVSAKSSVGRRSLPGTVTAINGSSFTLMTRAKKAKSVTVDASGAMFLKNGQSASSTDLAVNQMVVVTGSMQNSSTTSSTVFMATKVNIIAPMRSVRVMGIVQASASSTLTVAGASGVIYTIDASSAKISGKGHATLADIKVGDKVSVSGKITSGANLTAKTIRDLSK